MNLDKLIKHTQRPGAQTLYNAVEPACAGDEAAQAQVCGAMIWSSFAAAGAIGDVFDVVTAAQLHHPFTELPAMAGLAAPAVPLPETFWQTFEETLNGGPEQGYDATSITVAVASLGGTLNEGYGELAEAAARRHPGATTVDTKSIPAMISLDALAAQPDGSLARALHSMLVDNNFDAEVLDREAIGLQDLSPALRYLNTRILQMHDIWHLTAGYETTSLHEMAISAFQLAQFGHNYSAMFLATISSMSHLRQPQGFALLMQNIAEAWQHGRQAPNFMDIEWEQEWHQDIETVRAKYAIKPFAGSFPADLLEQLAAA